MKTKLDKLATWWLIRRGKLLDLRPRPIIRDDEGVYRKPLGDA